MKLPLEMLDHWERTSPRNVFLRQPINGKKHDFTWAEVGDQVRRMAGYLKSLNLPERSHIAIFSKNCAHWILADFAIWMSGHVSMPLYPNLEAHTIRTILEHGDAKFIFVGKLDKWDKMKAGIPEGLPGISFPYDQREGYSDWDAVIASSTPLREVPSRSPDEVATLIYTSGTTGQPKGVMHSFRAFAESGYEAVKAFGFGTSERFMSYLPLAHVAERLLVETMALYCGGVVSFAESLDTFARDLQETRPTIFLGVPRIWSKFQSGILKQIPQKKLDLLLSIPVVSTFVKRKILKGLGLDKVHMPITGAAPTPPSLIDWFARLGLQIQEAYGMTENLAYSHVNFHGRVLRGSVGQPLPKVETVLSPEGEVWIRSHATMLGYYKQQDLTREITTPEGYLRTGDLGDIDDKGYLKLTGRMKDLFKTSKGKYVAPVPIELKLGACSSIELACVVGTGLPQPVALVVLNESARRRHQLSELDEELKSLMTQVNSTLDSHERLMKLVVVNESWSIENGLLTPTLKVKRNIVESRYAQALPTWVSAREAIVWYNSAS